MTEGKLFKNPCTTMDVIVVKNNKVLLIERKHDPYEGMWALPGGFIDTDKENLEHGAARELEEETGLKAREEDLELLIVTSNPGRDPRGHIISHTYIAKETRGKVKAGDDAAKAKYWPLNDLPALAFDHGYVMGKYFEWRKKNERIQK